MRFLHRHTHTLAGVKCKHTTRSSSFIHWHEALPLLAAQPTHATCILTMLSHTSVLATSVLRHAYVSDTFARPHPLA
jgi:hypothetical protein